ncbi:MAG: hypothetical protein ABWX96_13650 [Propionibacteriaceae bacterium]
MIKVSGMYIENGGKAIGGQWCHTEGQSTSCGTALYAHAEGFSTTASGYYSHSEGSNNTASGQAAHVEGANGTASGQYSHAEGGSCTATGIAAHAEGTSSQANGNYSHASGYQGKADGTSAWAHGGQNVANIGATRAQCAVYSMGATVVAGGASVLTFDGGVPIITSGTGTNVLIIPSLAAYVFELKLSMRAAASATKSQGWQYSGMIARDAGNPPRLVGSVTQVAGWSDSALGIVTFSINTTSNYLNISCGSNVQTANTVWHGVLTVNELVSST